MSKSERFVLHQFQGCKTLDEAFHRAMGPKLAMLNTPVYRVAREAFFAGAAALDSMQSEVLAQDDPSDTTGVTARRLAALMDGVNSEIAER